MGIGEVSIEIVTHGGLGEGFHGLGQRQVVVPRGTDLKTVLAQLGVDAGLVGTMSSEGRLLKPETALECDCTVDVYAVVGGG